MSPAGATDDFLETAFSIGVRLCRDALWEGRRCNWQGPAIESVDGRYALVQRTFGPELYSGTSGIALFLARLYRLTGEPLLLATAEAALRQAFSRTGEIAAGSRLSFYCGAAGVAWAALELADAGAAHLGELGLSLAGKLAEEAMDPASDGQLLDLATGMAGAIPAFLCFHHRCGGELWLAAAAALGDRLLARARGGATGWSWPSGDGSPDLTGFSHGSSGMAWSLLELAEATGEERYRHGARQAFAHERHWYSAARENWPDLRDPRRSGLPPEPAGSGPPFPVLWCHGAAGIGLARLRAWQLFGDEELRAEAEAALRTTAKSCGPAGPASSFCLCHGQAGNAELFLVADQIFGENTYRPLAEAVGRQGIETYEKPRRPWPGGVTGATGEAPGLMLGTAGTGYFYLRLHDPQKTPSILIPLPATLPAAVAAPC